MSEYQYVAFRAIDAPVDKQNLAYMRKQSSRAEITSRSFTNAYHYGDFGGNAIEMLRRGYDFHLHYANYGIRSLFIRLPQGFPDGKAAQSYLDGDSLCLVKDPKGIGGVLKMEPYYEPDHFEEDLWDVGKILDRLVPIRLEIIEGDLRPLYLAHLAIGCDSNHDPEEMVEAPVPAGLGDLTKAQRALAKFWGLGKALLAAAAAESPARAAKADPDGDIVKWLQARPGATKDAWLAELMNGSPAKLRSEILTSFRKDCPHPTWPASKRGRIISQLQADADQIQETTQKRVAAETARKRIEKLAAMAKDPKPYLQQTEKLVAERSITAYEQAAKMLADLREALADTDEAGLPESRAQKLKHKNPTRRQLTAALRRQGFVPKA